MDQERFAALTRAVAAGSRRSLMRAAAAAAAGGALALVGRGAAPEAGAAFCRFPGQKCSRKRQCCANKCKDRVCGCRPKGATCFQNFGLACCSQKCNSGKCA